jgi:Fibronectin type III domain
MCQICGRPNYVLCNCRTHPIGSAPVAFCSVKYDASCIFYNLDPKGKNNLVNINLPNRTNVKTILDQIDILFGRIPGTVYPLPPATPKQDIFVKVDKLDASGDFLDNKVTPGNNITFVILNPGTNENIQIDATNNMVSVDPTDDPAYLIDQITGGTDPLNIVTLSVVNSNGTLVVVPTTNIPNLINAIENLPNFQNLFCQAVAACFPPPVPPPVPPPPPPPPCLAPSNLTVSITSDIALLSWNPPGGTGTIVVQYKLHAQPSYTTFATLPATASTESIPGLTPNVSYDFNIFTDCGNGTVSTNVTVTAIEIDCPNVTVTSTSTTVTASFPQLGGEIDSYLVLLLNSAGTSIITSRLIGPPFANPISATFNSLTPGTAYNIQVQPSNGSSTNTNCALRPIDTVVLPTCTGPSNLQVSVSDTTATITWTPDPTASFQNFYYGVKSGITGNPPGNGWTTFASDPLPASQNSVVLTGLTLGTTYSVALNSQCQNGNVTPFLTQDFTPALVIDGAITLTAFNIPGGGGVGDTRVSITFPTPTPAILTIYFGELVHNSVSGANKFGAGYQLFTLPAGYTPNPFYSPNAALPFVIVVPAGTTSFTTGTNLIYQTVHGQPWQFDTHNLVSDMSDLYVHIELPTGATSNFTLTNSGKTIHNV